MKNSKISTLKTVYDMVSRDAFGKITLNLGGFFGLFVCLRQLDIENLTNITYGKKHGVFMYCSENLDDFQL